MSEITGDKGEPIGVPKTCLYITLLNEKYVELRISFIAFINSSFVILVFNVININYYLYITYIYYVYITYILLH